MPFPKILNHVDNQIASRRFLKGIKGSELCDFKKTQAGISLVRWTLQAGSGDGVMMKNFPEAVSRYLESEERAFKNAALAFENVANIKFQYSGINTPFPVDLVARIANEPTSGSAGAAARTRVSAQNRYTYYYPEESDLYYAESRVSKSSGDNYNDLSDEWRNLNYRKGSYGFHVLLHEFGHNLGLKHTDDSNLFPGVRSGESDTDSGTYGLNNVVATVMSYRSKSVWNGRTGESNPRLTPASAATVSSSNTQSSDQGNLGFPRSLMALDIAVIQKLYGMNKNYNDGNNNYILPVASDLDYGWECIWDTGGTDAIVAPNTSLSAQIDLRNANLLDNSTAAAGTYSYIKVGEQGGFTIANDWDGNTFGNDSEGINVGRCVIENGRGAKGHDTIYGNKLSNTLIGYEGDDVFYGGGGDDAIFGDNGSDILNGDDGNDTIQGGVGSDSLLGGAGNDLIIGVGGNHQFGTGATGATSISGQSDGYQDIDLLTGGSGNDRFQLYGNSRAAYNDRNSQTTGRSDYAQINDFQTGADKIVLLGTSNNYRLQNAGSNTEIFLRSSNPSGVDELIASVVGITNLSLTGAAFQYVAGNPGSA